MDFYSYCNAKNTSTGEKVDDKKIVDGDENVNQKQEGLKEGKEECTQKAEDGLFGFGNRSEAAKKGWETRKQHGWNPKVGLKETGEKIPTWNSGSSNASTVNSQPKVPETKTEAARTDDLTKKEWRPPQGDIWDDRGKRNYFE